MTPTVRVVVTLAIFSAMLALIITRPRRLHEGWWTSLAAIVVLALQLVSPREALGTALAGKNALLLLLSLLVLSAFVEKSGFFEWSAMHCARIAHGDPRVLYRNTFILGAIVTALLSLDTTAVMLTPVVLELVRRLRLPATPYIVMAAFVANVGSLALPTSNLTNLIFVDTLRISFFEYALRMLAPQLVMLLVTFLVLRWHFRRELGTRFDARKLADPSLAITHRGYFQLCLAVLGLVLVGYFIGPAFGVEPYAIAFVGCGVLFTGRLIMQSRGFSLSTEISWELFPFVIGLFITVRALENLGILPSAAALASRLGDGSLSQVLGVAGVASAASNLINNLPAALLARSVVTATGGHHSMAYSALLGCDAGPMIMPFGSLATMLVVTLSRKRGHQVSIWRLAALGAWVTPVVVLAGGLAMWVVERAAP